LRVQVEAAGLSEGEPDRDALEQRAQVLLTEHEASWTAELRPLVRTYRYELGLIGEVELEPTQVPEHLEQVLRLAPVAQLAVPITGYFDVRTVIRSPGFARVRRLRLTGGRMGGAGARILAESPTVAQLQALLLRGQSLGQSGVQALAGSRYLGNLQHLDLTENSLSGSAVPILVSSPYLPWLTRLLLAQNLLQDSDVRALANSSQLSALRELDLSGNRGITNESMEALSRSPLLGRLHWLKVSDTQVTSLGLRHLRLAARARPELILEG
jgi:hypothetical protein